MSTARTFKNISAYGLPRILFRETFFYDLNMSTWAGRYQNFPRADIKYKAKVEVSRPFLLMPWTIDLSIDYCPYSRVTKLPIIWNFPGK